MFDGYNTNGAQLTALTGMYRLDYSGSSYPWVGKNTMGMIPELLKNPLHKDFFTVTTKLPVPVAIG